MPITVFLRFYCPGAVIFGKGGSNLKGGAVNGGAVTFRGGAVTFQNMRSVQTKLCENFTFDLLQSNTTLKFLNKIFMFDTKN